MRVANTDFMEAFKLMMAAQQATNSAMLGSIHKGFQAREKPAAEPAFNWLMTYTG